MQNSAAGSHNHVETRLVCVILVVLRTVNLQLLCQFILFFDASSWNCEDHRFSTAQDEATDDYSLVIPQLVFPSSSSYSTCKTSQKCVSDTVISILQGGNKHPVTAIWLIYCVNCNQFSCPNCYFFHYMSTSFQLLILEPVICDSGEAPSKLKSFSLQKGTEGLLYLWGPSKVLLNFSNILNGS